jgi:hypothetical protein
MKDEKVNNYFNNTTEEFILDYIKEKDQKKRNDIFIQHLEPIFRHLISGVIIRKKYGYLPDLDSLSNDCLIFLMSILDKFEPERGSKAYSYITRTTINWFYHEAKKYVKKQRPFENKISIKSKTCVNGMVTFNEGEKNLDNQDFFRAFYKFLDNLESLNNDERYKILIRSVKLLFQNNDELDSLNKKDINCYLSNISGLSPKEIYNYSNKFRKEYKLFRNNWLNDTES